MKVRRSSRPPLSGARTLLIRGTNWIGEAVMTLPALTAVRTWLPDARISVLAKPWVADVYRRSRDVDEVLPYESPGNHAGLTGLWRLAGELRSRRFDAAILLQNALEAAILARAAGIPIRAGYATDARGPLLTHAVRRTRSVLRVHQTRYYLSMVAALAGTEGVRIDAAGRIASPLLPPDREEGAVAAALLKRFDLEGRPLLVGMAPGATYGPAKKWFPERFAAVAEHLAAERGAAVLLFGGPGDRRDTEAIRARVRRPPVDLAGRTSLREAMVLIGRCRLFITNDSGLMHVAGALNIPTIALFGSTNPATTAPVGENSVILRHPLPCSPCLKTTCPTDFRCMDLIRTGDVLAAAAPFLEAEGQS
jgi:heptosyltransferase-2